MGKVTPLRASSKPADEEDTPTQTEAVSFESLKGDPEFLAATEGARVAASIRDDDRIRPGEDEGDHSTGLTRRDFWRCYERLPTGLKRQAADVLAQIAWAGCGDAGALAYLEKLPSPPKATRRSETQHRIAVLDALECWKHAKLAPVSLPAAQAKRERERLLRALNLLLEFCGAKHAATVVDIEHAIAARNAPERGARLTTKCAAFGDQHFEITKRKFATAATNRGKFKSPSPKPKTKPSGL